MNETQTGEINIFYSFLLILVSKLLLVAIQLSLTLQLHLKGNI